ncbi:MAG: M14 family zinc carboxypeptidase, partial [Kangiellaceae bacterium]|nr:M14 family zinc carboxypeptidase [Kangiellaceae bacterium]
MKNRLKVALTLVTASFFNSALAASEPIPYRVEVPNSEVARKVAISFHHAVLETNYKENYLILDLSKKEIELLKTFNLQANLDKQWQSRYQEHSKRIQSAIKNSKNSTMAGIPGYECYPTVEETFAQASQLATSNIGIAEWVDVGDSWTKQNGSGGYDLMVLKITNKSIQQDKPKLFIHSAMHAREYTTAALTLDFAEQLLDNYESNADYKWVIDYHEIHIMFHMNPDGRKIAEGG